MFELVTGRQPFTGDSALSTAVKRLKEPPPAPRTLIADLDPKWEGVILRCLERNPADRFASAADVVKALSGEAVEVEERKREQVKKRLAWTGAAAAALLLVTLAAGGYF